MKALLAMTLALSGAVVAIAAPNEPMSMDPTGNPITATMPAPSSAPQVEHVGEVTYLNGGAGLDEARWMKSQARDYALEFVISGRGGEYGVADSLTLMRDGTPVATVPDAGPYVLIDAPPGRYTVEAVFDGKTERRSVQLSGKGTQRINWNTLAASD